MLDMLTADAAAKHGHERPPTVNGSFFSQMPLSILGSVLRRQPPSTPPVDGANPTDTPSPASSPKNPINSDPTTTVASPTPSRPASSSSNASAEGKSKKKAPRQKTTYHLAHPPTTASRQKLHMRPKVLLQLQQVIPNRRPKPVYEILPFPILGSRCTRRLTRTFNTKDKLGANTLVIVKAEEYESKHSEERSADERWGARDVLGIICLPKKSDRESYDKTELLMDDGLSWEVTNMSNGGYEFNYTDDHGLPLKRRWIPKPAHNRRVSTMSNSSLQSPAISEERKFKFSTISATSRRHPIIASLTRTDIEVFDSYTMPSATSPPTPSLPASGFITPVATPASIDVASFLDKGADQLPVQTDDALRRFIVLSGIWVALSEGWSPAYSPSKSTAYPAPLSTSNSPRPPAPNRTMSMSFIDSPRSASPASTIDENRRTLPRFFRTGTQKLHSSASFTKTSSPPTSVTGSPSPPIKTRSRRSNSTGNADIKSKASNTRKRYGLGLEDAPLPETEEERQSKRSVELLRIKELTLPDTSSEVPPASPPPIKIIEPPTDSRAPSPASPGTRAAKTQSAYNPVTTAGLWDSGVTDRAGLKARPTSLVVVNEKKEKARRKEERSKSKEKHREQERDSRRVSARFKQRIKDIFRKDKT